MNNGQIAFYATVATAIPVVFVIYIVGAGDLAKKSIDQFLDRLDSRFQHLRWTRKRTKAELRASTNFFVRASANPVLNGIDEIVRMFTVFILGPASVLVMTGVLSFLVLSPVAGKYFALHALASDRASSAATTWTTIGLTTTGAYLLGPFVLRLLPGLLFGAVFVAVAPVAILGLGLFAVVYGLAELARRARRRLRPSPQESDAPAPPEREA